MASSTWMDRSLSKLPEITQTHVHWVGDAIQPSHPLSSPSPPALNLSQHEGLFKWVSSSHQVAEVLEFQLQHQCFQWALRTISFRINWLDLLAVQGTLKSLFQYYTLPFAIRNVLKLTKKIYLWQYRAWQPTPVSLPGESHGQRNLAGYIPYTELDMTEVT